jgi:hypothetical protein
MRRALSDPSFCLLLALALIVTAPFSSVPGLWAASIIALIVGLVALGWHLAPPVLAWLIAFNMLPIWADVATIELNNSGWTYMSADADAVIFSSWVNLPDAIVRSSCAIAFLAIGLRCGLFLGREMFGYRRDIVQDEAASLAPYLAYRISLAYVAFLPASVLVGIIGQLVPALSQPAHVFGLLKFVLIYLLAARVFATGRNAYLLVLVIAAEIVLGSIGPWAGYKEGFFVVLIALAASSRRFTFKQAAFALAGIAMMLYMSLVWTAVKEEFRPKFAGSGALTALAWLADKYLGGELDFAASAVRLLERVGYTKFYAMIMNANTDGMQGIYQRALLHIVTPRVFFPDKAVLDDSAQTAQALGWSIDKNTSVGLGYVAQAHIDFGFPGLLAPMIVLGAIIGTIYAYFLTRPAPPLIREACAVACLFNALAFEGNIDKQLGGMIWALLVLALALRNGAAIVHRWLENSRQVVQGRPYRMG